MEGGIGFGLGAVLFDEITLDQGRVVQSNFNDYRMLRINEMPKVDVVDRAVEREANRCRRAGRSADRSGRCKRVARADRHFGAATAVYSRPSNRRRAEGCMKRIRDCLGGGCSRPVRR